MDKDRKIPPIHKDGRPAATQNNDTLSRQTEELMYSAKLFQSTFENASIPMALGLEDGTFARTNAAFDRMIGYGPGELVGVHRSAITPAEDVAANEERYRRLLEGGLPNLHYEKRYVRKDGRVIWIEMDVSFIRDKNGIATLSVIVARDITERKRMEEALRESEDKYRSLLEHAYDAIMISDFEGNLLELNKKAEDLLGYAKEELSRANISKIHPEEEQGRILRSFRQMVEGKAHFLSDTRVLTKDGRTIPVDISGGAIRYGGRQVALAIFRDITDHKRIEKQLTDYREHLERLVEERTRELRESEEKYRNIFENAVMGIFQSTPEGRFLNVNPAFARMHGYETPGELIRSITNIATQLYANPEDRRDFLDTIEREGIVKHFQIKVRLRDGSIRYMFLNERAVKDERGKTLYFEGTVDDITEKRLAFEQVMAQRDLAVQLSRIDSLEEGLHLILKTAMTVSGMECGGISLKNKETGGFDLVCSIGCADDFLEKVRHVGPGSFTWSRMVQKQSFHTRTSSDQTPVSLEEGFKFVSVVPMLQGDEVVGFLVTASMVLEEVTEQVRMGLEALAAESGNVIARMQTSRALETEHQSLLEANTALKVLLRHREEDREQLEQALVENVKHLVLPHLERLKKSIPDPVQRMNVSLIESNLNEIISPFLNTIQSFNLTPRQLDVAILIREGRTSKDIAHLLNVSKRAVDIQRFMIRKKLGLNRSKTNLQSYLQSLAVSIKS